MILENLFCSAFVGYIFGKYLFFPPPQQNEGSLLGLNKNGIHSEFCFIFFFSHLKLFKSYC